MLWIVQRIAYSTRFQNAETVKTLRNSYVHSFRNARNDEERLELLVEYQREVREVLLMCIQLAIKHVQIEDIEYNDDYDMENSDWNVWTAAEYSISLYTSIGARNRMRTHRKSLHFAGGGAVVCTTARCRAWTVIYTIIGIPFTLFVLIELGSMIASLICHVWANICHRCSPRLAHFKVRGFSVNLTCYFFSL